MKSQARVEEIRIHGFRGQSAPCRLPIEGRSALIFGANGTGKSTITDAIEFALQGTVGRSNAFLSEVRPQLINVASQSGAECVAVLTDGSFVKRRLELVPDPDNPAILLKKLTSDGASLRWIAPMALKRSDIIEFLATPAIERGRQFFDVNLGYGLSDVTSQGSERLSKDEYGTQIAQLNGAIAAAANELARILEVNPQVLPRTADRFSVWRERHIRQGNPLKGGLYLSGDPVAVSTACDQLVDVLEAKRNFKDDQRRRPSVKQMELKGLESLMENVGTILTAGFGEIYSDYGVERFEVRFAHVTDISIEIEVVLKSGQRATPQQLFSEGLQDLVAFLFFLAVTKAVSSIGQPPIIILDDVIQSVDAEIRTALLKYILSEFSDWQIILSTHDRQWKEHASYLFRTAGHPLVAIELGQWSPLDGIRVRSSSRFSSFATIERQSLAELISSDSNPGVVAGQSGRLLELCCQELSISLASTVQRKRDHEYTLGDLWGSVRKSLRRTELVDLLTGIDSQLFLRNSLGAHWNEWALDTPEVDLRKFAEGVLSLFDRTCCSTCGGWISASDGNKTIKCKCGLLSYSAT